VRAPRERRAGGGSVANPGRAPWQSPERNLERGLAQGPGETLNRVLSIQRLRKTYRPGFEALRGIDLDVAEGDFFALLGPNGAGKSTTIGILTSLIRKTSGSVRIFGYDLDTQPNEAKAMLGIVPQEINFSLFEKCLDIVVNQGGYYGLPRAVARANAEKYLRVLNLWDKRDKVSRQLSGGMKRKLMIARALVHEPRLLILDEPTAGLDVEFRRELWDFLVEFNRGGATIVLTTHYLEEAERLCRNVAIIDQGRIVENTTLKRLLAKLDIETFLLDTSEEVRELPEIPGYRISLADASTVQVEVSKGERLNRLFQELSRQGIGVISMRNKSNRLEELFLRLLKQNGHAG